MPFKKRSIEEYKPFDNSQLFEGIDNKTAAALAMSAGDLLLILNKEGKILDSSSDLASGIQKWRVGQVRTGLKPLPSKVRTKLMRCLTLPGKELFCITRQVNHKRGKWRPANKLRHCLFVWWQEIFSDR